MLSVEILADAVLTCGRTARLVSSQTNFNVDVYSAVTADFLKLPSRWDAWQMLFALMGERRGRFPHRRTSTLYSAFMEEFLKLLSNILLVELLAGAVRIYRGTARAVGFLTDE